jgi:hypothetical protein
MIFDVVKIVLIMGLVALMIVDHSSIEIILGALTDAYIAVSSFVAITLLLFYMLEHKFKIDTKGLLKKYSYMQVPFGAVFGALPGCGGAIMVITQYVRGYISFGSVVAVLTATMGDAAFLLLAQEPATGLFVMLISLIVGLISGYVVDAIHGKDFLRPHISLQEEKELAAKDDEEKHKKLYAVEYFWYVLLVPGFAFGVMNAFQLDINAIMGTPLIRNPETIIGVSGALLCVGMWLLAPLFAFPGHHDHVVVNRNSYISSEKDNPMRRVVRDTNFITSWVVFAFLLFEIFIHLSEVDLKYFFMTYSAFVPFVAIMFGFIPGCGPQILVTTLYLEKYVSFSAQIGNAISNDGDALFPAIALAPKASLIATVYSAIPAIIVAYGYYFLFE